MLPAQTEIHSELRCFVPGVIHEERRVVLLRGHECRTAGIATGGIAQQERRDSQSAARRVVGVGGRQIRIEVEDAGRHIRLSIVVGHSQELAAELVCVVPDDFRDRIGYPIVVVAVNDYAACPLTAKRVVCIETVDYGNWKIQESSLRVVYGRPAKLGQVITQSSGDAIVIETLEAEAKFHDRCRRE